LRFPVCRSKPGFHPDTRVEFRPEIRSDWIRNLFGSYDFRGLCKFKFWVSLAERRSHGIWAGVSTIWAGCKCPESQLHPVYTGCWLPPSSLMGFRFRFYSPPVSSRDILPCIPIAHRDKSASQIKGCPSRLKSTLPWKDMLWMINSFVNRRGQ
jgi:hypothetical protein